MFRDALWQGKVKKGQGPFFIAEIGKNFIQTEEERPQEEYLRNALELIALAKQAGADAVKFQTHNLEDEQANIQVTSPHFSGSDRYNWVRRNTEATPVEFWREVKRFADEQNIIFFSTPMSRGAAVKLETVGVPFWKVGSGDLLDFVLLDYLASTRKPIILSSGMSTLPEIDQTIEFLKNKGSHISLLHCVSKYPASPEELNLRTIEFLRQRYGLPIGFSDHSIGWESAVAAANIFGAVIIEKHFSKGRDLWGADHKVSMTPEEFKLMADKVRFGEKGAIVNYGRAAKVLNPGEAVFRPLFRKSLAASREIKAGEIIYPDMINALRPAAYLPGIPSEKYEEVVGKKVTHDMLAGQVFQWENIAGGRKRKVCFVITSKIHYSRSKLILEEIKKHPDLELQLIIGASAILDRFGDIRRVLAEDGFEHQAKIVMSVDGGDPVAMAKTTGLGVIEFATALDNIKPDIVLLRGDRFEILSAAIAAAYLNLPIAHIEGGDVTGTIDESVRHAVTKLAHIHFATNELSRSRIIRMGENPEYVFNFGAPDLEVAAKNDYSADESLINSIGVGDFVDIDKPFLLVIYHPVTSEFGRNRQQTDQVLTAVHETELPVIWFWPNADAGTDEVSKAIRAFREKVNPEKMRFIKYLEPDQFIALLKRSACLIGNSSSGIKEGGFLGVPVVNIGSRQSGRLRGENVLDCVCEIAAIKEAINRQLSHGHYQPSDIFYQENTSQRIAEKLAEIKLYFQKKFVD